MVTFGGHPQSSQDHDEEPILGPAAASGVSHGPDTGVTGLLHALADCVVEATEYGEQEGGFVAYYILPTGPLHRAIPLLQLYGITVRPGFDGRKS